MWSPQDANVDDFDCLDGRETLRFAAPRAIIDRNIRPVPPSGEPHPAPIGMRAQTGLSVCSVHEGCQGLSDLDSRERAEP